jgi:hypothetical protein
MQFGDGGTELLEMPRQYLRGVLPNSWLSEDSVGNADFADRRP